MNQKKLRVGVIGVGHLGKYHVEKYRDIPDVELVGVVDADINRAKEIARTCNTMAFEEFRDILDMVDAVSLAVPTEMHFELGKAILSRGIHLLIEKPITYRLKDADTLLDMAAEKGLALQVGHVERFNPAVIKMESMLDRPIFIESHRLHLFTPRGTDVDVVLDLMIHDIDIILHVVKSKVKDVHAVGLSVVTSRTDIANARLIFENGAVANLTANRVSNKIIRKIRIFQPDTYLSTDCLKREISVTRLQDDINLPGGFPQIASQKMKYPGSDPLADEISSFVKAVINSSEPAVTGSDGRNALKVAIEIIDQIEKGCKTFKAVS